MNDICVGLALSILAAGLSPRIPGLGYDNLRAEDGVFAVVFLLWLVRCAKQGRLPTPRSPLTLPFVALTLMATISTLWGMADGYVRDLPYAALTQIKRIEYFLIFWVVATSVTSARWLRALVGAFILAGVLAVVYGALNPEETGYLDYAKTRIAIKGENYNTFSGYLVVCLGVAVGALGEFKGWARRLLLLGAVGAIAVGMLFAFSREGLIMLLGALAALLSTRHRGFLLGAVVCVALALTWGPVRGHLEGTVTTIQESPGGNRGGNSLTARFNSWDYHSRYYFLQHPILGCGVGSVPFEVDNEYLLRLCEGGIIGLMLFFWVLSGVWRQLRRLASHKQDSNCRMLQTALLMAFVGLLIQGLAAASFTTIRTMEPFWFLLGLGSAALAVLRTDKETRRQGDKETRRVWA